ncbi:hypothetical protein H4R18_000893 [Coemansia javaensis]|uniref:DUF221-domain-containing protein n=1 Tax=Coemansia javaensis TaxID=2761396 RepID=A0A9W8HEQ4_9FUNG|nr:hypothetical protein H4R18_000893 [Coemansia javaensis]
MADPRAGTNGQSASASASASMLEAFMFGIFTDDSQVKQQYLSIIGLLYQAGINLALCAGAFLLFVFLRPNNARVYARRYKALANDERRPPKIRRGLFAWAPVLWRADEEYLISAVGIDSAFFLRFLRLGTWLMGIFGVVGMCLIVPMNFVNGNNEGVTPNLKMFQLLWITLFHITKPSVFWLHAACAYAFTAVFVYFVWREYRHYIAVKQAYFASPEYLRKLQSRTIMLTRVPPGLQDDARLRTFITNRGSPTAPLQVSVARKIGQLQELINDHEKAVRQLERLLHMYLGGDIKTKPRPQIKVKGRMVDGIEHYAAEIEGLEFVIGQTRREIETFKPASVGFVSYAVPPQAHNALRALRSLWPMAAAMAPHPKDIIWSNVQMTHGKRFGRQVLGWLLYLVFCFVAIWPVAALTFIGDAANIQALWPNTAGFFERNSTLTTIWQTTFSPLVLFLYYILMPYVFRIISRYQGTPTHTGVERTVLRMMYMFYFLSNIIVFTLVGLVVRSVFRKESAKEVLESMPRDFIQSLNVKAQFWTAYVSLKGVNAMFEFAQILSLVTIFFKRYTRHLTPRELRDLTKPPDFDYSPVYSLYLWIFTISMFYSVYAPIAMPFAFVAFGLAYWVYKYAVLYVYQTRHDTAGAMWRIVMNCMFISMVIFQVYLVGCLQVRISNFTDRPLEMRDITPVVYALCPLPVITAIVGIWLHFWMGPRVNYMARTPDAERYAAKEGEARFEETLGDRFLHPTFSQPLPTPMVDKRVRHLLPRIYRGRTSVLADAAAAQQKAGLDAAPVHYAPSISGASTVYGSDTMDLESVMDERDRRDFDGAASPIPFRYRAAGTAGAAGAFRRGPSALSRRNSVDSSVASSDIMEMDAMGGASKLQPSGSRANLLGHAQSPSIAHSPEYADYDGNATVVGRSASPGADGGALLPVALYGDGPRHPGPGTTTTTTTTTPAYGDFGAHQPAPGPWYGDGYAAAPGDMHVRRGAPLRPQPSQASVAWQLPSDPEDESARGPGHRNVPRWG